MNVIALKTARCRCKLDRYRNLLRIARWSCVSVVLVLLDVSVKCVMGVNVLNSVF